MRPDAILDSEVKGRDRKYKKSDVAAVHAMVQAAINVELFTIPLYMVSMYSIVGMHQITSKNNDFYKGRWWPGAAPSANPETSGANAFNLIFSVFIEEMLHLQLASNMANALGAKPRFTSPELQTRNYGWKCYGDANTTIPHILDFTDCRDSDPFKKIRVKLDSMNATQIELFLAIEETMDDAKSHIDPKHIGTKYFKCPPFDGFEPSMTETNLPMFGSIGWMYHCLWAYIEIEYDDGTSLLDILVGANNIKLQRDLFNHESKSHPMLEYPGFNATIDLSSGSKTKIKMQILNMINAITDQGEGSGVAESIRERWNLPSFEKVEKKYQPSPEALIEDYPGHDDSGRPAPPSGQAKARIDGAAKDHFEIFTEVKSLIREDDYETWDTWHLTPGHNWTAEMLNPSGAASKYNIPSAEDVAGAFNELKSDGANYELFTQAAIGTIAGITTVLNTYWQNQDIAFPSPAMYGSGDRVSICWAIFGRYPDLTQDAAQRKQDHLYHSCQGMDFTKRPDHEANCAAVEVFHSCKGSNHCKAEGGCGFVHGTHGGGSCRDSAGPEESIGPERVILPTMSAPSDNRCGGFGGCAIPISASQLFPAPPDDGSYIMLLYNFGEPPEYEPKELPNHKIRYDKGDAVYDIAWKAYCEVMAVRHPDSPPPEPPPVSKVRLAFPPST